MITDHGRAGVGCIAQQEDVIFLHPDLAVLEVLEEPGRNPIDELVEDRKAQGPRTDEIVDKARRASGGK